MQVFNAGVMLTLVIDMFISVLIGNYYSTLFFSILKVM